MHTAIVITSIASSTNKVLQQYAAEAAKNLHELFIIGDEKSPSSFNLKGANFYSIKNQLQLNLSLVQYLPTKHYARKNLGYLLAMQKGYTCIKETDDDNIPYESFFKTYEANLTSSLINSKNNWVNIYSFFSRKKIWPRGLPLTQINSELKFTLKNKQQLFCPIQQGLADGDPDVDAIYRLLFDEATIFTKNKKLALAPKTWSPFNSQNTIWFKEAFMLMYIPSYCSFRMCDIWRSFIAQRIAHEYDWPILYFSPTVTQIRNAHNLQKDFTDEVSGYLQNQTIKVLLEKTTLSKDLKHIGKNLIACYATLIEAAIFTKKEMTLVKAWVKNVQQLLP
jgi:hypothetical protein